MPPQPPSQNDLMRYDRLVDAALRGVIRQALEQAATDGLPGGHHFYITFNTRFPGVELPDHLAARFQDEMTIVLQYQFYGLEVTDALFEVSLSFSGRMERLVVPLAAITTFVDPAVNFALQFQIMEQGASDGEAQKRPPGPTHGPTEVSYPPALPVPLRPAASVTGLRPRDAAAEPALAPSAEGGEGSDEGEGKTEDEDGKAPGGAEIVSLDKFRRK